jgi:hypothetical protein
LPDEGLYNRGISIESDVPIVAYAHIYDGANSGAGMLLPTGAWGYEYTTLNSSQYYSSNTYSWFTVIADRDSTLVEITPAVASKGGRPAGVPFQLYMNRGQVYQVMGTTTGSVGTDMSGSRVLSYCRILRKQPYRDLLYFKWRQLHSAGIPNTGVGNKVPYVWYSEFNFKHPIQL